MTKCTRCHKRIWFWQRTYHSIEPLEEIIDPYPGQWVLSNEVWWHYNCFFRFSPNGDLWMGSSTFIAKELLDDTNEGTP